VCGWVDGGSRSQRGMVGGLDVRGEKGESRRTQGVGGKGGRGGKGGKGEMEWMVTREGGGLRKIEWKHE
jgi:hypothetical protein